MNPKPADRSPMAGPEIIAVASKKGGVGKTTTALNLAIGLVAAGRTVLLVDLDPNGHAVHTLVSGAMSGGGTERLLRQASLTREMITATEIPDLFLVAGGSELGHLEHELALLGDSRTRLHQAFGALGALSPRFDHIVLDCPPGVGLLTLNALAAAHRILLPVPAEPMVLEALPTLLKTISRLRAGLKQPFHALHLLVVQRVASASTEMLIKGLRRDYGQLMLLTEIPFSDKVREASERGRPLLAHCPQADISQAYLELAAEWLLKQQEGQDKSSVKSGSGISFRARKEFITAHRGAMQEHIQAWLRDPSSLLYDASWEDERHQDTLVFDELFHRPPARRRLPLLIWPAVVALVLLAAGVGLWFSGLPGRDATELPAPPLAAESPVPDPEPSVVIPGEIEAAQAPATGPVAGPQAPLPILPEPIVATDPVTAPSVERIAPRLTTPPEPDNPSDAAGAPPPLRTDLDRTTSSVASYPKNSIPSLSAELPETSQAEVARPSAPASETVVTDLVVLEPPQTIRWQVQLLAGASLDRVRADSQQFLNRFGALLDNHKLVIRYPGADGIGSRFYRLRVLDWDDKNAAEAWCWQLRRAGQQCLVMPVISDPR